MSKNSMDTGFFSRDNLKLSIRNLSYLPRWIIVMIDISVLTITFFFTLLIFRGTGLKYINTVHDVFFTVCFLRVIFSFFGCLELIQG